MSKNNGFFDMFLRSAVAPDAKRTWGDELSTTLLAVAGGWPSPSEIAIGKMLPARGYVLAEDPIDTVSSRKL